MNRTHSVIERLQEVYRVDKTFLRILESQARHNDDLMFVNSCMQNLIEETKKSGSHCQTAYRSPERKYAVTAQR